MVSQIERVLIYAGHNLQNHEQYKLEFDRIAADSENEPIIKHVGKGPYSDSVQACLHMFWQVNQLFHNSKWAIEIIYGEQFTSNLMAISPNLSKTILVIPAGKSTDLDNNFTEDQIRCIKTAISVHGLNYFATCGSAYWSCTLRQYETPSQMIEKWGKVNLYNGLAKGPISPDSMKYGADFFHESVTVTTETHDKLVLKPTLLLSGGGAFCKLDNSYNDPLIKNQENDTVVLAKYSKNFLDMHSKDSSWEAAALKTKYGVGTVIFGMPNPAYDQIDPVEYKAIFPERSERWDRINNEVSSLEDRMSYAATLFSHFESKEHQDYLAQLVFNRMIDSAFLKLTELDMKRDI